MKLINLLLPVLFLLALIPSCKEESCNDIYFEDQYLDPVSKTYFHAENRTAFIFHDQDGNKHRYELAGEQNNLRPAFHQDSCDGESITINHNHEYILRSFASSNETRFAYAQVVDFLDHEEDFGYNKIVDILKVSVYNDLVPGSILGRICIMTSNKQGALNQDDYNDEQYILRDSVQLLDTVIYNVLEQKNGLSKMYYTKENGIVSFTDNQGNLLVLERIE